MKKFLFALVLSFISAIMIFGDVSASSYLGEGDSKIIDSMTIEDRNMFFGLSESQQQEVLKFIKHPELISAELQKNNPNLKIIRTESIQSIPTTNFRSATIYQRAEGKSGIQIFGISILEFVAWVEYKVENGKIAEVLNSDVYESINYNIFSQTDIRNKRTYITDNKVYLYADIIFKVIHKTYGANVGAGEMWVVGGVNGYEGGGYRNK